jgi:D-glycero-D-manno-heptose 1,7-bisphosphate phosphatase
MNKGAFDAVFLDRDGVINEEDGIVRSPGELRLLPGSGEAIARLNQASLPVIVITNQPVVARGWCTEAELDGIHRHLRDLLRPFGASLDAIYYCPHHENANLPAYRLECACRKPRPGLLKLAAEDFALDLSRCVMIGDRTVDLQAARAAGAKAWLVRTGFGGRDGKCAVSPDSVFDDLREAVSFLLDS